MKTEKAYQEKVARTIQQKLDGSGSLQFVDNRSMNLPLQRIGEDEDDTLQGKFDKAIQLEEDEDESLQMKPNNTGLPDNLKAGVENLSGYSLDDVKVHYNSSQPATVQALAYISTWLRGRNSICPMRPGM